MAKKHEQLSLSVLEQLDNSGAGYDIIRYISLPDLLGSETDTLLYFMGKNLARKFEISSLGDIIYFFEKSGWGKLELIKEKKHELIFHLLSDAVVQRLQAPIDATFRLEAGFLAEAIYSLKGMECECIEEIHKKIHQIEFKILFTN
ncbi:DUF2507 domain-containing protein [Ornithinibacillus sp. L9]|uniref:DUF2507 domain-containing protein n=1 Tax=Ornithinibacillus caprae TaxID=2678566 RepID=A0A6N8FE46_9BACI|nr:YslB family protein [Ornithinibacillus caprae]MUK86936.1 DUF2507 domain-containing protein [Ornithinibacillus caprae]